MLAFPFLFGARFRKSDGTIGLGALGQLCLSAGIWRLNGRAYYTMLHITSRNFPFQSSSYSAFRGHWHVEDFAIRILEVDRHLGTAGRCGRTEARSCRGRGPVVSRRIEVSRLHKRCLVVS